ncbi:MAG: valine--tRNA ligase [Phycisphaerales bacterium]|nr:valine--tRNA ligase [Phycisphaerales bacterium]
MSNPPPTAKPTSTNQPHTMHANGHTPSPAPSSGLPKAYSPAQTEPAITAKWDGAGAFHVDPARVLSGEARPYCIFIPPPNVTAALHLGHALNNTLQDVLIRAHRMMGFETLWMPGTDHAGIATQAVVEKRVLKEEGKRRNQFTREEFIAKIQAFKDEYEATITAQLKEMGASCDWQRQRFTMDEQCAAAVREAFFRLFKDGLIDRGKRLVNWDPALQTAVADDECYDEEISAAFYYLRYPLVHAHEHHGKVAGPEEDPQPVTWSELAARGYPGAEAHPPEQEAWVTVATTRPETYLGDTAVAINPKDPRAKSLRGLFIELPLVGRIIPVIEDDYVVLPAAMHEDPEEAAKDPKAMYATGFLKVTPAHDPNDWEIGVRHKLSAINVMAPDATISDKHGWTDIGDAHIFVGKKREEARKLAVKEFEARGLLEGTKPYTHSVKHSDRSKAIVEPYLSDQWYVRVTDPRMAARANAALVAEQRTSLPAGESARPGSALHAATGRPAGSAGSPDAASGSARVASGSPDAASGGPVNTSDRLKKPAATADEPFADRGASSDGDAALKFHPARYAKTYEQWHDNIRDWCISRQLWWGHRIPVWSKRRRYDEAIAENPLLALAQIPAGMSGTSDWSGQTIKQEFRAFVADQTRISTDTDGVSWLEMFICVAPGHPEFESKLISAGLSQDPDVLDTWFSSALWPMSTLGWPEPAKYAGNTGMLEAFNPSSVLCTAREIITLWVSRMVMFNRYFRSAAADQPLGPRPSAPGPVPFRDVFIHAMIQDGEGRKMSKSLGNGVDPRDIIESHGADAMRFTLVQMTTNTQDVRMPVQKDSRTGKNTSPKFDNGRNFCNKLWNTARFVGERLKTQRTANSEQRTADPSSLRHSVTSSHLSLLDRWMLSRLATTVKSVNTALANYEFSDYAESMYKVLWWDLCDWYLEGIKPTVETNPAQQAVLAHALETIVRLLHPITPFITEAIWEQVREFETAPIAGVKLSPSRKAGLLCTAGWPEIDESWINPEVEAEFEKVRELIAAIRNTRSARQVAPKRKVRLHIGADGAAAGVLETVPGLIETLGGLDGISTSAPTGAATAPFRALGEDLALSNIADAAQAAAGDDRDELTRKLASLRKSEETLNGRLNNPGYIQRAPAKLVEESKAQLAKLHEEIAAIESRLK